MTLSINDIKAYLRITHNVDDTFLTSLMATSKSFIAEQTGVIYQDGDKVYEQCVLFMVAHLYDNRAGVTDKVINEIPYTLDALIRHIKLRGEIEIPQDTEQTQEETQTETPTETTEENTDGGGNNDEQG